MIGMIASHHFHLFSVKLHIIGKQRMMNLKSTKNLLYVALNKNEAAFLSSFVLL